MPAMRVRQALFGFVVAVLVAIAASQPVAPPRLKLSKQSLDALDTSFSRMLVNAMHSSKQAPNKVTAAYADNAANAFNSSEAVQPEELDEVEAEAYDDVDDAFIVRSPHKPTLGEWFKKLLRDLQDEVDAQDVNYIPPSYIWPKKGDSSGDYQQPNSSPQQPHMSIPSDGGNKKDSSGDKKQPIKNPQQPHDGYYNHKGQKKGSYSSPQKPYGDYGQDQDNSGKKHGFYSRPQEPQYGSDDGYNQEQEQDSSDEQPGPYGSPEDPQDGGAEEDNYQDENDGLDEDSSRDDGDDEQLYNSPQEPQYGHHDYGQRKKGSDGQYQQSHDSAQSPYHGSEPWHGDRAPIKRNKGQHYRLYRSPQQPHDHERPWHRDRGPLRRGSSGRQHYAHRGPDQPRYDGRDSHDYDQQYMPHPDEQYKPDYYDRYGPDLYDQHGPYEQHGPDKDWLLGPDEQHWPDYDDHFDQYEPDEQYSSDPYKQYIPDLDQQYDLYEQYEQQGPRESEYACVQETARSECQPGGFVMVQDQIQYISSLSCCSSPASNKTSAQSIFGNTASLMSFSHAMRTAAASSRNSSSQGDTAAAAAESSDPEEPAGLPSQLASHGTRRMLLEGPSDGDAHCLWTMAYFEPVDVTPETCKIGVATAYCRFSGPMDLCATPLCEGLTLEISAEVFTTYAVSRDGPVAPAKDAVAPTLDGTCATFDFGFDGHRQIREGKKSVSLGVKGTSSPFKIGSRAHVRTPGKSAAPPPVQDHTSEAPELEPAPTQSESTTEADTSPSAPAAAVVPAPAPSPATLASVTRKATKGQKGATPRPAGYLDYRGAGASTQRKRVKLQPAKMKDNLARVAKAADDSLSLAVATPSDVVQLDKSGGKMVGPAKAGFKSAQVPRTSHINAQIVKAEGKQMGGGKAAGNKAAVAKAGEKKAPGPASDYRGAKAYTQYKRAKAGDNKAGYVQVSTASLEKYAGPMYGDRDYFTSTATVSSVAKAKHDSGLYGGKATIVVGAITSVTGLKQGVQYSNGLIEHVVRFEGAKKLTAARYEELPYDTPHIFPGKYKIVLMNGKSELEFDDLDFGAY